MGQVERRFQHAVQALAQPGSAQRGLFPDFVCVGNELAMDFDGAVDPFLETAPPQAVIEAVRALEDYLEGLASPVHERFWLAPQALEEDPRWQRIRDLAGEILLAQGWEATCPPKNGKLYWDGRATVKNE